MPMRPLKMPRDAKLLPDLIIPAFQYPDHPEWGVQADEAESIVDQLRAARMIWPLLAPVRLVSAPMRDVLRGVIWEEDGKPVGTTFVMRQGASDGWLIANVAVLPAYRRHGIAQRMVRAAIDIARSHGARVVWLDVIAGNVPAVALYERLGFERFDERLTLETGGPSSGAGTHAIPSNTPSLPPGYRFEEIAFTRWREQYDLAKRVTPEAVTRFRPVEPAAFRLPLTVRAAARLLGPLSGDTQRQVVVRAEPGGQEAVGTASYSVRTRKGGIANCSVMLDTDHPELAAPLLGYVTGQVARRSPGRRLEVEIAGWQNGLLTAAPGVGLRVKLTHYQMGLRPGAARREDNAHR